MSVVTNLLLAVSSQDCSFDDTDGQRHFPRGLQAVKNWCEAVGDSERDLERRNSCLLIKWPEREVDHVSGGTRHMEVQVWAWGANYLDLEGFLEAVRTARWRLPEGVQVFVREQDDDRFRMYNLTYERTWEVWPANVIQR